MLSSIFVIAVGVFLGILVEGFVMACISTLLHKRTNDKLEKEMQQLYDRLVSAQAELPPPSGGPIPPSVN